MSTHSHNIVISTVKFQLSVFKELKNSKKKPELKPKCREKSLPPTATKPGNLTISRSIVMLSRILIGIVPLNLWRFLMDTFKVLIWVSYLK